MGTQDLKTKQNRKVIPIVASSCSKGTDMEKNQLSLGSSEYYTVSGKESWKVKARWRVLTHRLRSLNKSKVVRPLKATACFSKAGKLLH